MKIDSKELTDYITSVLEGIHSSQNPILKDYIASQGVMFDLKVIHKKGAKGGLKILIANAEGEYEREVVSRITFTMQHRDAMKQGINALGEMFKKLAELDKKPALDKPKKSKSKQLTKK